jgi:hypothetical protein
MSLVSHAEHELKLLSDGEPDEMQQMMNKHILEMVKMFAEEGHSGFSASYAVGILEKLLRYEPLKPLTGDDSEWVKLEYGDDMMWQNKRCSHVFKGADGRAYDSQGRIFREPNGNCYQSSGSRVYIEFPYTPTTEYVDRPGEAA